MNLLCTKYHCQPTSELLPHVAVSFRSTRSASWPLRGHSITSERTAEKNKNGRVCLILRSRPYGELRRRLAVAVLDGVEIKGHCTVKNTQAQQNEGCAAWFFLKCDYEMFKNVSRDEKKNKKIWKHAQHPLSEQVWEIQGNMKMSPLTSKPRAGLWGLHTHTHTHTRICTHRGPDTHRLISSQGARHVIYMQNPQSPESPC